MKNKNLFLLGLFFFSASFAVASDLDSANLTEEVKKQIIYARNLRRNMIFCEIALQQAQVGIDDGAIEIAEANYRNAEAILGTWLLLLPCEYSVLTAITLPKQS